MKLYELAADLRALFDAADDTGELSPDVEARLDALTGSLADKVGGVLAVCDEWAADAEAFEARERAFAEKKKNRRKKIERLRAYALRCLEGVGPVKTDLGTVTVRTAGTPKVTEDEAARPEWTNRELETLLIREEKYRLDRPAILAAWKAGEPLPPGVEVSQTKFLDVR